MRSKHNYLIKIQFLGFRFHGWAKQPGVKTVHEMVDRTLNFVFGHDRFKTLAGSRTDARVSAKEFPLQLFLDDPISDTESFLLDLNINLPADIEALSCSELSDNFNIIQSPKSKEYHYYFYFGSKKYPFAASLMSYFPWLLDIELMQEGAAMFKGEHDFRKFVTQPAENTNTIRTMYECEVNLNTQLTGSVFPPESYVIRFCSAGFMRHQIRLMSGQLVRLGSGQCTLKEFKNSIHNPDSKRLDYIAPGSGLVLFSSTYSD